MIVTSHTTFKTQFMQGRFDQDVSQAAGSVSGCHPQMTINKGVDNV